MSRHSSFKNISRFAGDVLAFIGYHVEHFLVLCVEILRRAVERFDRDNYAMDRRIRRIVPGRPTKSNKKYAIFVLWCAGPVPAFTKTMIEALARSDFDLVVVTNRSLDPRAESYVVEHANWLIERTNKGRDFGAYKDGVQFVFDRFPDAERLVIANDSLFYLPDGLDALIEALGDERHDVVGVSEVFEHHYHVASFLMAFGRNVLRAPAFAEFWHRYLPLSTRRWAILRGEGRLSAMLVNNGFDRHILYPANGLTPALTRILPDRLSEVFQQLPKYSRKELLRKWGLARYDAEDLHYPADFLPRAATARGSTQLATDIVAAVEAHNQMHVGGVLFRKLLGLPMIKRDIVHREIFAFDELTTVLDGIEEPLRTAIFDDLMQRGDTSRLSPLARAFHRHSAI